MGKVKTTLILNDQIKKQAQLKAIQENSSLSEIVNSLLTKYVFSNSNASKVEDVKFETWPYGDDIVDLQRDDFYD